MEIPPAVDQLEIHAYLPSHNLVNFLKKHNIVPEAYSPLGSTNSPLWEEEHVKKIAKKHDVPASAVLLGYLCKFLHHLTKPMPSSHGGYLTVARGIVVLPKSVTPSRIIENSKPASLHDDDIATLDALAASGKQVRLIHPPWGVVLGFEDWYKADVQKPALL